MLRFSISVFLLFMLLGCSSRNSEQDGSFVIDGKKVVVPLEVDGEPVPPDPGSDGDDTLLGIDHNVNGVRDDVERYIYARFQGFEHANKERAIAMQYVRAVQHILEFGAEKAMTSQQMMSKASECEEYYYEQYHLNEDSKSQDILDAEYKDIVFNTRERLEIYFDYNAALSGKVFTVKIFPSLSTCEVDITKIEN